MTDEIYKDIIIPELKKIEGKIDKICVSVETINKNVDRLNTSVMGDKKAGIKGQAERIEDLEKHRDKQKRIQYIAYGGLTVLIILFKYGEKILLTLKKITA
jgi:hypothetical protein